jgi:protein-disulfide isomerase
MRKAALFMTAVLLGALPGLASAATQPQTTPAQTAPATAMPTGVFNDTQRAEIETIIHDYLTQKHPEVMAEGLQTLQKRDQEEADAKTKQAVGDAHDRVYNDARSPVGGNPKGDVTVVEFYDYQCGYCKMSEAAVEKLLKTDKNVKFIYKDFPILGPSSAEAAKASLASMKQGKFQAFHDALMKATFSHGAKPDEDKETIAKTAKEVGMDVDKLKKDMGDKDVTDEINDNLKLGQDIGVRGTPMFVINDQVFPGAMQEEQLEQAVTAARDAQKKP